ncbi:MAG: AAA family ATPase [Proteobacteria bacterium]|nr:AAA family ATPase [Pseudomonadota bacterium]
MTSSKPKVLLVRGARQVGKTYSIRQLAKKFTSFVEVNFLESNEVSQFFTSGSLSPKTLIEKLQVYYGKMIVPGETLLFFDEIQACPEALTALRFFYEQIPKLHVVASGRYCQMLCLTV